MVHHDGRRRTSTLSISLPPELARAIEERVEGGLYTSASELIREALRLLLKVEAAQRTQLERRPDESTTALRFATTMELFNLGNALRLEKLRQDEPGQQEERLRQLSDEQEAGPGLRIAPERLEKLKLRE